jgi:hypothetical protein
MTESNERSRLPAGRRGLDARTARRLIAALLVLVGLAGTVSARASATVTLPGGPLSVSIGPLGQCQSNYVGAGDDFFPGDSALGDCGFFLAFVKTGNPTAVREKVFGFAGANGPGLSSTEYTPVSAAAATGAGSASDPFRQVTTFKVTDAESKLDYALITETTTYVGGDPQFTSTFDVQNVTGQTGESVPGLKPDPVTATLKFHAIYAGDLFTNSSDFGTGLFLPGPPRFVGGQNTTTGVLGGFVEAGSPSPPWSDYQTGCWDTVPEVFGRCPMTSPEDHGLWAAVRAASGATRVFDDDIDPNLIDNAAGVSWDDNLSAGLAAGAHASYSIINRAEIPAGLSVTPATQTHTVGDTATVSVTATSTAGAPYANRPLVYSIGSANPKSGSVLTDASGVATIRYVGTAAGADTVQAFLDLAGTGIQTLRDPSSTTQVAWLAAPATPTSPNSGFRVRSVRASSNGTITISFVPVQDGTASLAVTAPSATLARIAAAAAAGHCKRNQTRIRGRCLGKLMPTGKATARGRAGIALTIVVKSSAKVRKALARGRTVPLTAKLTYKSRFGGKPTTRAFQLKVRGRHKHHR